MRPPTGVLFNWETVVLIVAIVVPFKAIVPTVEMSVTCGGVTVFARWTRQLMVIADPLGTATCAVPGVGTTETTAAFAGIAPSSQMNAIASVVRMRARE